MTIAFGTAVGFAVAGLLASGYAILSGRPLVFAFEEGKSTPELLMGMLARAVAGPYLLARNAIADVREGLPNPLLVAASIAVACMWGCLSGIIIIDLLGGSAARTVAGL